MPATSWAIVLWRNHLAEASPRTRALTVHMVCWALVGVNLFDGLGLAYGGDAVARTSTYDVLRVIPGGMKTYGVLLILGAVSLSWALGKTSNPLRPRAAARWLQFVLAFGVGYYLLWSTCIPLAWWHAHMLPAAWPALSKYVLMAFLYFACARAIAPARP